MISGLELVSYYQYATHLTRVTRIYSGVCLLRRARCYTRDRTLALSGLILDGGTDLVQAGTLIGVEVHDHSPRV